MKEEAPLTLGDYNDVVGLYHAESDRAAAILAAAFLEEYMGRYLKSVFIKDRIVDELFENNGPLSGFDSRSKILYAMKLIPKICMEDIKYIKKIRNHFAHYPSHTSFDTIKMKDLCSNLSTGKPDNEFQGKGKTLHKPRDQYLLAIGVITARIFISYNKYKKNLK